MGGKYRPVQLSLCWYLMLRNWWNTVLDMWHLADVCAFCVAKMVTESPDVDMWWLWPALCSMTLYSSAVVNGWRFGPSAKNHQKGKWVILGDVLAKQKSLAATQLKHCLIKHGFYCCFFVCICSRISTSVDIWLEIIYHINLLHKYCIWNSIRKLVVIWHTVKQPTRTLTTHTMWYHLSFRHSLYRPRADYDASLDGFFFLRLTDKCIYTIFTRQCQIIKKKHLSTDAAQHTHST